MSKYDGKLVDELLGAIDAANMNGTNSRVDCAIKALKPKPAKFYVLPTWGDFVMANCATSIPNAVASFFMDGYEVSHHVYHAIREATAPEKPMVHIPAGDMWSEDDLREIVDVHVAAINRTGDFWVGRRAIIDFIKAKLEPKQ
jgi:hypothetical protein